MKIFWCAVYEGKEKIRERLDLCGDCLEMWNQHEKTEGQGLHTVPYDTDYGICEECGAGGVG